MYEESELKLTLSPEAAAKLAKAKGLKPVKREKRRLVSTYFDTPRQALHKSAISLRVRDDGAKKVQTVKAPFDGPAGLQNFREWTAPLDEEAGPTLDFIGDEKLAYDLARRRCAERLTEQFVTDIDRTTLVLKNRGARFEMAINRGVIRTCRNGNSVEEPVCEAELELIKGDPAGMLEVALELCETHDVRPVHLTKAERGYALVQPALRPQPVKPPKVILSPEQTVGESFHQIIAGALDHLFRNEIPTLEGRPEGVHQTRVAMRRLRAAMRAFKKVLPYDKRKAFNGEFRWFQQRLAPARDWHVFLDETLPQIPAEDPQHRAMVEKLRRIARAERRRASNEAKDILLSRRYARMILQFERWLAVLEADRDKPPFKRPVRDFARTVLRKTHRDFMAETRPLSRLPGEDLHELRKRGKKARYAAEFFSALWTGDDVKPFLKDMEKVQDRFGEANDAAVARQILAMVNPARLDTSIIRLVQDWSDNRIRNRIQRAQPRWRRFRTEAPFWED